MPLMYRANIYYPHFLSNFFIHLANLMFNIIYNILKFFKLFKEQISSLFYQYLLIFIEFEQL